ncbi:hypothetical protein NHQ30_011429 [Ciborinia camelliae]|nr:hypothetical protein NHQ30_011429 [Ciborinia camelliae]
MSSSTLTSTPTPTTRHTASQSLSASHIATDTLSSTPLLQTGTSIPALPPPSATTTSLLNHLQNLLDFTSTLLALFIASVLTLLFVYWSSIYILSKTSGLKPPEPLWFRSHTPEKKSPPKKEVGFAPHPSDVEFYSKAQEIKRRLARIGSGDPEEKGGEKGTKEGTKDAGLGEKSHEEKGRVSSIAKSTGVSGLASAAGRKAEDVKTEADLQFQRGVADVGGDT